MSMSAQRSVSRRGVLAAAGAAATGGCIGLVGGRVGIGGSDGGGSGRVSVLAAGSLARAFSDLGAGLDAEVQVEAHGSVTCARLLAEGQRDPDIVALADPALFGTVLERSWHARVATNALVVVYDPDSRGGRAVRDADRWFDPVLSGTATLGRTDPDLDPLGYRTLFALRLAGEYYDRPGLPAAVLRPDQVYPETSLLSRFETGELDAAVVYRSMAADRGFAFRELPAAVDLSDPARDDQYRGVSYTLASGETVRGKHVAYGVRARSDDGATRRVFDRIAAGDLLADHGFVAPETFPTFEGEVPRGYRQ
jgi:molybdate/tungstate transport system substrate-binding protein